MINQSEWMSPRRLGDAGILEVGDLIEMRRSGYCHWGVYVGEVYVGRLRGTFTEFNRRAMVIHLTSGSQRRGSWIFASSRSSGFSSTQSDEWGGIRISVVDLIEASDENDCRINNYLDVNTFHYSPAEIVKRAREKIGPSTYNLLEYNCEHFATWCRYGFEYSHQAQGWSVRVLALLGLVLR